MLIHSLILPHCRGTHILLHQPCPEIFRLVLVPSHSAQLNNETNIFLLKDGCKSRWKACGLILCCPLGCSTGCLIELMFVLMLMFCGKPSPFCRKRWEQAPAAQHRAVAVLASTGSPPIRHCCADLGADWRVAALPFPPTTASRYQKPRQVAQQV